MQHEIQFQFEGEDHSITRERLEEFVQSLLGAFTAPENFELAEYFHAIRRDVHYGTEVDKPYEITDVEFVIAKKFFAIISQYKKEFFEFRRISAAMAQFMDEYEKLVGNFADQEEKIKLFNIFLRFFNLNTVASTRSFNASVLLENMLYIKSIARRKIDRHEKFMDELRVSLIEKNMSNVLFLLDSIELEN